MASEFRRMRLWSIVGLLVSAYASYVELKAEQDKNYVAMCDISKRVSCSAVFTSEYGRCFGLAKFFFGLMDRCSSPNGILGIVFYTFMAISSYYHYRFVAILQVIGCFVANLLSIYLSYLLYYVLQDLCVVCIIIYIVNYFLFIEAWKIFRSYEYEEEENANVTNQIENKNK